MEFKNFENHDSLDPRKLESLSRMYMIQTFPGSPIQVGLTDGEKVELEHFLTTAPSEHVEEVKKTALFMRKYFTYTDETASQEEKDVIEEEMDRNSELKEYIESAQAEALTEKYTIWRYGIDNAKKDPEAQIFEMTDDEIFTFFNLLDKYPNEVDQTLSAMTSEISVSPHDSSKFVMRTNEVSYLSEREKLLELRDYFTGKMSDEEKGSFSNEIIDDINFRSMFVKIQNALR